MVYTESQSRSRLLRKLPEHFLAKALRGRVKRQSGGDGEPAEFGKNRTLRFSGHP